MTTHQDVDQDAAKRHTAELILQLQTLEWLTERPASEFRDYTDTLSLPQLKYLIYCVSMQAFRNENTVGIAENVMATALRDADNSSTGE
jgi:hypothetical protein